MKRNSIEVTNKGGKIEIEITKADLYMTGPAIKVFDGIIKGGIPSELLGKKRR